MRQRWPVLLSATALVVALLGSTPLGEAAERAVAKIPPFAKRSDFATRAGTAENAKKLGGRSAGAYARLDANGKLPLALLAGTPKGEPGPKGDAGAKGDKGDKGEQGDRGPAGLVAAYSKTAGDSGAFQPLLPGNTKLVTLALPAGRFAIMAQATIARSSNENGSQLFAGCRLIAGDSKATVVVAGAKAPASTFATASTVLVHEFAAPGTAHFECNDAPFGESSWASARITALQVASTRKSSPVPGGGATAGGGAGSAAG